MGGKPDKIKRAAAIGNYENGGIKAPDIKTFYLAQRIMWLKRYYFSENNNWKIFFEQEFSKVGGPEIFQSFNISLEKIKKNSNIHPFYFSILNAWCTWGKASNPHTDF